MIHDFKFTLFKWLFDIVYHSTTPISTFREYKRYSTHLIFQELLSTLNKLAEEPFDLVFKHRMQADKQNTQVRFVVRALMFVADWPEVQLFTGKAVARSIINFKQSL